MKSSNKVKKKKKYHNFKGTKGKLNINKKLIKILEIYFNLTNKNSNSKILKIELMITRDRTSK